MQVFRAFLKIVQKRIGTIILYFTIFIGIALGVSAAVGKEGKADVYHASELTIVIDNQDEGILGEALCTYLGERNIIENMPESEEELLDGIFYREIEYVLYIPQGYTNSFLTERKEDLLKGRKVPSSAYGTLVENEIIQYLKIVSMYLESGISMEESISYAKEDGRITSKVSYLETEIQQEGMGFYYFQYIPYVLYTTLIAVLGPILFIFLQRDINARNKCSSMPFAYKNMQLILGSVVLAALEGVLLLGVAAILLPEQLFCAQGGLRVINMLFAIFTTLGITFLLSQIAGSQLVLNTMSTVVSLALSFLGGVFVSLELFDEKIIRISKFLPTYWYVIANKEIGSAGRVFSAGDRVYQSFLVQGGFCIALVSVGMLMNRMKARS